MKELYALPDRIKNNYQKDAPQGQEYYVWRKL